MKRSEAIKKLDDALWGNLSGISEVRPYTTEIAAEMVLDLLEDEDMIKDWEPEEDEQEDDKYCGAW